MCCVVKGIWYYLVFSNAFLEYCPLVHTTCNLFIQLVVGLCTCVRRVHMIMDTLVTELRFAGEAEVGEEEPQEEVRRPPPPEESATSHSQESRRASFTSSTNISPLMLDR